MMIHSAFNGIGASLLKLKISKKLASCKFLFMACDFIDMDTRYC